MGKVHKTKSLGDNLKRIAMADPEHASLLFGEIFQPIKGGWLLTHGAPKSSGMFLPEA